MRKLEKIFRVYVNFMGLKEEYGRVNRKVALQLLRMYDVGGNLLNGIKSMF